MKAIATAVAAALALAPLAAEARITGVTVLK